MSLKSELIKAVDAISGGAFSSQFREAASSADDHEPKGDLGKYRRLSSMQRDLSPMQFAKAQQLAFYLWQRNPLAQRIIQILKDFCVGDDFSVNVKIMQRIKDKPDVDTKREDGQKIWDDFFNDPINRLNEDLETYIQDLFLNGELVVPASVNNISGAVRLGYIDPTNISKVITNPKNMREVTALELRQPDSAETTSMKVIQPDIENKNADTYLKLSGEVLYFRLNKVMNQSRGHSELLQVLDWIDGLDQFLFNNLEGGTLRNAFFYWLKMTGKTQVEIDKMTVAPPHPGTVRITNEKADWEVITPDLKAADNAETTRLFKNFILAGKGYPEHWFADGGQTNLATAGEMGIPTMRMLKAKQNTVKNIIKFIAQFVVDQALIYKSLKLEKDEYVKIDITAYDFERKDAAVLAAGFVQTVTALSVARSKGWVSDESAKKVVDGMLKKHGIEIDQSETIESIKAGQNNGEDVYDEETSLEDIFKGQNQ